MTSADTNGASAETLAAYADAASAVLAADSSGEIVYANRAAETLLDGVDDAARRTLARVASEGAEGLARLRLRRPEGLRALTFRCRRITLSDGRAAALLEGVGAAGDAASIAADASVRSEADAPLTEAPAADASPAEVMPVDGPPAEAPSANLPAETGESGDAPSEQPPSEALQTDPLEADAPPDPRRDMPPATRLAAREDGTGAIPEEHDGVEAKGGDRPTGDAAPEQRSAGRRRSGNVVPLHGGANTLSSIEESAFAEIARRLGGLGNGGAPRAVSGEPDTAEIVPAPPSGVAWTIDDVDGRAPTNSRADDLTRLIDKLPIGVLVLRGGIIAYANRAALEMTGAPDLRRLAQRGAEALFAEPPPAHDAAPAALRLVACDGVEVDVEARLSTIAWRGGPAILIAMKRAEGLPAADGATRRERELSAILDTATDGVMTLDGAGRVRSVNRSAEALFGCEAREMVGNLFTLSLAPESRRIAFDYLDSLKGNGVAAILNDGREVLGLTKQGGAIPLYLTMGRLGPGPDARFCAVLRDVTHWKRAEEELIASRRLAERANAQKSEFLAKVSHEIRTPLNAIIGFAEVIIAERFGPIGNQRYKEYLRDIHLSGEHLIGLVNDLLDLSRIEAGRFELAFAPVDLNEIVAEATAVLQPHANRQHVIVRASLARSLPPVLADRKSLRQILANLASHAVRHSRPGGQVIVATSLNDLGQAVIRVRDAGVGMTDAAIARALEPFRKLPPDDAAPASGVGLPLTKALAEANHAMFSMRGESGAGTLMEVTFPANRVLAG